MKHYIHASGWVPKVVAFLLLTSCEPSKLSRSKTTICRVLTGFLYKSSLFYLTCTISKC